MNVSTQSVCQAGHGLSSKLSLRCCGAQPAPLRVIQRFWLWRCLCSSFLTWVFICLREVELAKMWHRVEDPWIKYPPGRWCIVVLQTLHHPDFSRVPHYLGCLSKVWAQCFAPSILFRGRFHLGWNQDLYKCGNTPVLFEEPNRSRNFPTDLFKHCCITLWTMLLLEAGPIPLLKMRATFHQIDPSTSMSPNCKL